jgi:hypothetical protein
MIKETITFTFEDEAQRQRFHERLKAERWKCGALAQGTAGGNEPADCDWPSCGCDPYVSQVIEALHESGWRSPDEVQEYARKTREIALQDAAASRQYDAD